MNPEPKSPSGMDETFNGEDALAMVDFSLPPGYFTWLVRRSTLPPSGTLLYPVDPAPLRAKIAEQESELAALRARVEAAEANERRYRWLRSTETFCLDRKIYVKNEYDDCLGDVQLDEAIDAALTQPKETQR